MAMVPHERSLVKRLEGKPFALLGINIGEDKETLRKVLKEHQITWRSWWDGGNTKGPIASQWRITAWPTVYVLDHKGVIRYKGVAGRTMDEAVDTLLNELQRELKSPGQPE